MSNAHLSNHVPVSASSHPSDSVVPPTSDSVIVEQPTANSSLPGDIAEVPNPQVLEHDDSSAALVDNNDEATVDNNDELLVACDDLPTTVASSS
ncbi:hypothetical protein V6N13_142738 [Hibiscus sabdariffa]|uniref:Uncharacterized protein n=1 Tax=Hibiscus sabdariffa TaxID=183260 RepID=A0ABR2FF70_9ROSI